MGTHRSRPARGYRNLCHYCGAAFFMPTRHRALFCCREHQQLTKARQVMGALLAPDARDDPATVPPSKHRSHAAAGRFRATVLERDGQRCRGCGAAGVPLVAHHIARYADRPDLRENPDNGITLCKTCHRRRHPDLPDKFFR